MYHSKNWNQLASLVENNNNKNKQTSEIASLVEYQKAGIHFANANISYHSLLLQTTQQAFGPSDLVSTDRNRTCTCCPSWLWTVGLQLLAPLAHLPSMYVAVMPMESSSPAMPQLSAWAQPWVQELSSPYSSVCSSSLVKLYSHSFHAKANMCGLLCIRFVDIF